ncbi:hypothetical protein [Xanthomonas oryzae]|uniref:hypothetical protein n=1 Tax=Xanthomonas oryzae TaxID=347 RepID=UPI0003017721|nr:hypothetical protein [Xanthomonas oryzae]AOS14565.1 hypothetical protein ATY45_08605 [Xanthomonas oryzae pv. oryzae]AXM39616.1 hypothetical protein BRN51_08670 [Xanthomonas oryzae pv. oryzae]AXQ74937.1 hypothetical protein BXU03_09235 [Xanthomonas oryzae pv. oryzae]PNR43025.1 hypothetical protein LA06_05875 [Xanthomonas oryzae pv. oryzae]RBB69327.1 hypothetical protein BRN54_09500 [Xanthomonas oryzae pv. oryzae]
MRHSVSSVRVLSLALLASATVAATSGCSWFHKGARGDYALAPEARPLEVPPDLNLPDTSGAMKVPTLASTTQQQANTPPSASANSGFTVPGERDEVFGKVGAALADIPGLTIASKAQMLGSYDVSYEGSSFLVRVVKVQAGNYVSAVDPRGMPATAAAPVAVITALKGKLGG